MDDEGEEEDVVSGVLRNGGLREGRVGRRVNVPNCFSTWF